MKEIYEKLGYSFKNEKLLSVALTHRSFSKTNYERLEFLGDSILDFYVADYLYRKSKLSEGELTRLRASFVSEDNLYKVFDELELGSYVRVGRSYTSALTKAIKADVFEAIVGAIYLDGGLEEAEKFVEKKLRLKDFKSKEQKDPKTRLQEYIQQASPKSKITYRLVSQTGYAHSPEFEMALFIDNKQICSSKGKTKQDAEQECARLGLEKICK